MVFSDRIAQDGLTIRRLDDSARRRDAEAECLGVGGHRLAAIDLYGYVVEMIPGAALFRVRRRPPDDSIDCRTFRATIKSAMGRGPRRADLSHPIEGLAILLLENKADGRDGFRDRIEATVASLAAIWGPRHRVRDYPMTDRQVEVAPSRRVVPPERPEARLKGG